MLHDLLDAATGVEMKWFRLEAGNPCFAQRLAHATLRARTGASVVAILRQGQLMANPKSMTVFQAGDCIGLIGDKEEIEAVEKLSILSDVRDLPKMPEKPNP